jgi:hypothetical protein
MTFTSSLANVTTALDRAVADGNLGAVTDGIAELGRLHAVLEGAPVIVGRPLPRG